MSALDQLQYLSWLLYLFVFGAVLVRTIRRPTPAHVDMALFFGAVAVAIVMTTLTSKLHVAESDWAADVTAVAALALGYLLLRLVRDFSEVPTRLLRAVEVGLIASIGAILILPTPLPTEVSLLLVAYLGLVIAYDTRGFARQAANTRGVTRRRMQAVALGSLALVLAIVVAAMGVAFPHLKPLWDYLSALLGLASGGCYFVGFAPPTWLRRAWQEPEIRAFLARTAGLPRLPAMRMMLRELERGAADALGAPGASIGVWNPETRRLALAVDNNDGGWLEIDPAMRPVAGRAFIDQRVTLVNDARRADPENAEALEQYHARTVLAAPITIYGKRLGVLVVYAPRAPVFANSDLELVQLLADHAAVILENRTLLDEAARVAAREETTRLKEDFLSSAAHDLKTPLTGIVTQAQILQRRAERDPHAPADRAGLDRLLEQSLRLKDLVLELLDVSRLEQGGVIGERQEVDIGHLISSAVKREPHWTRVEVRDEGQAVAPVDTLRLQQVLSNLIENALKYSPHDKPVVVRVWSEEGEVRISVQDEGIGIPIDDQPLVFDRYFRARNVDHRRFVGMGLGLYIARAIIEQHGGRIWLESSPGKGSTFFASLPGAAASGIAAA